MPYKETLIFEETSVEKCKCKISNKPINRKINHDEHISVSNMHFWKKYIKCCIGCENLDGDVLTLSISSPKLRVHINYFEKNKFNGTCSWR